MREFELYLKVDGWKSEYRPEIEETPKSVIL
jgi:hypothetical protein